MRKQIGIMFDPAILSAIDAHCKREGITRTRYIEDAVKAALQRDKIAVKVAAPVTYWEGNIDDMPLIIGPEYKMPERR